MGVHQTDVEIEVPTTGGCSTLHCYNRAARPEVESFSFTMPSGPRTTSATSAVSWPTRASPRSCLTSIQGSDAGQNRHRIDQKEQPRALRRSIDRRHHRVRPVPESGRQGQLGRLPRVLRRGADRLVARLLGEPADGSHRVLGRADGLGGSREQAHGEPTLTADGGPRATWMPCAADRWPR